MRVLVVNVVGHSSQTLAKLLRSNGVVVDQTDQGEDAIDLARYHDYDLLLTDVSLPDIDGYELIRRLRNARIDTPVILQANHLRSEARIKAFNVGVDDIVTMPCDHAELFARMQAIVRRSKGYSQPTLRCGQLQINLDSRDALVSGHPVHLTGKEYAILELLVLRKGMVLTKEVFLNHLYGGMDEPEMKIIDVFICKLRRKLAEAGAPNIIGTIWGRGYMVRDPGSHSMQATTPKPKLVAIVSNNGLGTYSEVAQQV